MDLDLNYESQLYFISQKREDLFKEMLQLNGVTSLYSIARGFIQSTTSQTLAVGNVLLPMFNVAAYSKDLNEKEKEKEIEQ